MAERKYVKSTPKRGKLKPQAGYGPGTSQGKALQATAADFPPAHVLAEQNPLPKALCS